MSSFVVRVVVRGPNEMSSLGGDDDDADVVIIDTVVASNASDAAATVENYVSDPSS